MSPARSHGDAEHQEVGQQTDDALVQAVSINGVGAEFSLQKQSQRDGQPGEHSRQHGAGPQCLPVDTEDERGRQLQEHLEFYF